MVASNSLVISSRAMEEDNHFSLAAALTEYIKDELEFIRQQCYHYGPPLRYKWNGGNPITLCGLCGTEIQPDYWTCQCGRMVSLSESERIKDHQWWCGNEPE